MRFSSTTRTLALSLLASTVLVAPTLAAETQSVQTVEARGMSSYEYSARELLGYVSEARVALSDKHGEEAANDVDAAMRELATIRNTQSYLAMTGLQFGHVVYGKDGGYYIPVADDVYAVRTYGRGPFWSGSKAAAVKDVQLVSVDVSINPDKTDQHLQAAQTYIANNNFIRASAELKDVLADSLHESSSTYVPFTRLQDNVYLTRVLIRQHNYEGARYTLRNAKSALSDYEKTLTSDERRTSAEGLRQDIDALRATIDQRDPTAMEKASARMDQWWSNLKSWMHEKTS